MQFKRLNNLLLRKLSNNPIKSIASLAILSLLVFNQEIINDIDIQKNYSVLENTLTNYLKTQELQGRVEKIIDGDTLRFLSGKESYIIRLYGIDAPEKKQSYGKEATLALNKMCPINTEAKIIVKDEDKYKRAIGILECNARDINAEMVKNGFAWAYREYSSAYVEYELMAKSKKVGLWNVNNPIKPSEFRRMQ
ncbi:thermonuclease family protein [Helicobacter winghamensis]|uniref:thermonuclease family protein n=1 Tax=Helicobacter winghamensis TaxID=157268 RepID=UPI00279D3A69